MERADREVHVPIRGCDRVGWPSGRLVASLARRLDGSPASLAFLRSMEDVVSRSMDGAGRMRIGIGRGRERRPVRCTATSGVPAMDLIRCNDTYVQCSMVDTTASTANGAMGDLVTVCPGALSTRVSTVD